MDPINYVPFEGGGSFNPVTPASRTRALQEEQQRQQQALAEHYRLKQLNSAYTAEDTKTDNLGLQIKQLGAFSKTLNDVAIKIEKQSIEDRQIGATWDFLQNSEANPIEEEALKQVEAESEQIAADAARLEQKTGDVAVGGHIKRTFNPIGQGLSDERVRLMQAQTSYGTFLNQWLASDNKFTIFGQPYTVREALESGDSRLIQGAIGAGRVAFIRENKLHLATKTNFVNYLGNTILQIESSVGGQVIREAIKNKREGEIKGLTGLGYEQTRQATTDQLNSTFQSLSTELFTRDTGLSRGAANEQAVKTMVESLKDSGNVEGLQALLDVEVKPGEPKTALRYMYGNEIYDAIEEAQGNKEKREGRLAQEIERNMYQDLGGAQSDEERASIIEAAATQLEEQGLWERARELRDKLGELSTAGNHERNAQILEESIRRNEILDKSAIDEARLRGDITSEEATRLESLLGNRVAEDKASKDPAVKGLVDSYGDRFDDAFLQAAGLQKNALGQLPQTLIGQKVLIGSAEANLILRQARTDLNRLATLYIQQNPGLDDQTLIKNLHSIYKEWWNDNVMTQGGKYYIGDILQGPSSSNANGIKQYTPEQRARFANLVASPGVMSRLSSPSQLAPQDFSGTYSYGSPIPRSVVYKPQRGDRLFTQQETMAIAADFNNGTVQRGLQVAANSRGITPLALLNQQLRAYGLDTIEPQGLVRSTSASPRTGGNGAPASGVSGAQQFMRFGFPTRGAAYLSGNVQQESSWRGQRTWDDQGALAGGIASWRGSRLTAAIAALGPIEKASTERQVAYLVQELNKPMYAEAKRIFMNPYASTSDLRRASKIFWGYGDPGQRYQYAEDIETSLRGRGRASASNQFGGGRLTANTVGKHLLASGIKVWQQSGFDLDKGWVGRGGRVGQRSNPSYHDTDQALDIPISHNSPANLRRTFAYLKQNMQLFGIAELYWDGGGFYRNGQLIGGPGSNAIPAHGDHIHVAFK